MPNGQRDADAGQTGQPQSMVLGNLSFALLLGTLWLGMAAGSVAVLSSITDMVGTPRKDTVAALRVPESVADSAYRTWDDVATAPLPEDDDAGNAAAGDGETRRQNSGEDTPPPTARTQPPPSDRAVPAPPRPDRPDRAPPRRQDGIVDL